MSKMIGLIIIGCVGVFALASAFGYCLFSRTSDPENPKIRKPPGWWKKQRKDSEDAAVRRAVLLLNGGTIQAPQERRKSWQN